MSKPSQDPAMEMLGMLMLTGRLPVNRIIRPGRPSLLRTAFTITDSGLMVAPTVTDMTVTTEWDNGRYEQKYTAELEYLDRPRLRPTHYVPEVGQ